MVTRRSWTVGPGWTGEDAFVICGGTSVRPDLVDRLRGRPGAHVVVINSSYLIAPWAEILFFADDRWWAREVSEGRLSTLQAFEGQIVTIAHHTKHELLWHLHRSIPSIGEPLATKRDTVALERTSLTGVLNLCLHKGAKRIILVGADNRDGPEGRTHHHAEYPWDRKVETWRNKAQEVALAVAPLRAAGVEVINASPDSTFPWWDRPDFESWLEEDRKAKLWENMA